MVWLRTTSRWYVKRCQTKKNKFIFHKIIIVITVSRSIWMTTNLFLYGCNWSPDKHGSKLGSQNPNSKWVDWFAKQTRDSKLRDSVTREEGLAPSRRPFWKRYLLVMCYLLSLTSMLNLSFSLFKMKCTIYYVSQDYLRINLFL